MPRRHCSLAGPWQVRGVGAGSPKPSLKLAGAHALKAHSQAQTAGKVLGREDLLTSLKPHPVCAESSRLSGAPGGWGIPEGLSLFMSLRLGLTVALR